MISSNNQAPDFGGSARSPLEKNPLAPASLTQHPSLSTPLGRSTAMRAGRSTMASQLGTAGQSKVDQAVVQCMSTLKASMCMRLPFLGLTSPLFRMQQAAVTDHCAGKQGRIASMLLDGPALRLYCIPSDMPLEADKLSTASTLHQMIKSSSNMLRHATGGDTGSYRLSRLSVGRHHPHLLRRPDQRPARLPHQHRALSLGQSSGSSRSRALHPTSPDTAEDLHI